MITYIYIYTQLFTQFFLNGILPRNNNMTRSKCQNWELAIATVVTRNDLYSIWRGENGQFIVQGRWWQTIIYCKNKVSLKTSLKRNSSNFSYISLLDVNFENLTIEFHVPYVLNMHIKFRSNRILFTIWSINLFFIYNFRLQKLEIITFRACLVDCNRRCNVIVIPII